MKEIDLTARSDESMRDLLRPVALAIKDGGLAVVPTTTYYALAADAMNPDAVRRVFSAKKRSPSKPLIVLVDSFGMAKSVVRDLDPRAQELDWRYGSKGLTYVLHASERLPPELTSGTGTVAVRVERHEVIQELLALTGTPITGSSANVEGQTPAARVDDAVAGLRDWLEIAVRWWPSQATAATTMVDFTSDEPRILREGTVPADDVLSALGG
jgi:L-threonylcarbamoyladenylate synthase